MKTSFKKENRLLITIFPLDHWNKDIENFAMKTSFKKENRLLITIFPLDHWNKDID
jgi:hypothetical protein